MLKTLLVTTVVCASFTLPIQTQAQDERPQRRTKGQLTEEQRTLMKELRGKYDTNKDGKLDGEERKAMSAEDKDKLGKVLAPRKKKAE